ncbi:MAG TPA: hypothetical protein VFS43_32620 [Polyangiaceae bacterium]|nr:hypothetical protein [Polyangiaceae bacterium]
MAHPRFGRDRVPGRLLAATSTLCVLASAARPARACGAAYPGGPMVCNLSDAPQLRPLARVGASYAFTSTTLLFGEGRRADFTRHAAFASVEVPVGERFALSVAAGGVLAGALDARGGASGAAAGRYEVGPGLATAFGGSFRAVDGRGAAPLVLLTGTVSFTHAGTRAEGGESPTFTAFDGRLGALVGKTIADVVTPYALGRVFGGPIFWRFGGEAVTGTDLYKYQVGGGATVSLFRRQLDVFVEGVALGERGASAGAGFSFF